MAELVIDIVSYVDEAQPGWVRCAFHDANNNKHYFIEKAPVVTAEFLDAKSIYPKQTTIPCQIINKHDRIFTIDISNPLGIESEDGISVFDVLVNQLK